MQGKQDTIVSPLTCYVLLYVCFVEITDAEKMNQFLADAEVPVIVGK